MRTIQEITADLLPLVGGISPEARERDRDKAMALINEAYEAGQHVRPSSYIPYTDKARADQYGAAAGYNGAI